METGKVKAEAYDLEQLGLVLKAQGLEVLEGAARKSFISVVTWLKQSAAISSTPWDDLAFKFLEQYEKLVLEKIDGIDGKTA